MIDDVHIVGLCQLRQFKYELHSQTIKPQPLVQTQNIG